MKIVIVGGVAGGMSAATRLRRLMEDAEIVVFEKGPYVSFANCGLPYYLSGEISERENLLVQTPESLSARFCLDVRPNHEVTAIFPENKTVEVVHEGQKHIEQYDALVLSPGAKPVVPSIPGITEADNVFSIRNVPDIACIRKTAKACRDRWCRIHRIGNGRKPKKKRFRSHGDRTSTTYSSNTG